MLVNCPAKEDVYDPTHSYVKGLGELRASLAGINVFVSADVSLSKLPMSKIGMNIIKRKNHWLRFPVYQGEKIVSRDVS